MIKINLLESVTNRSSSVSVVEDRVANPRAQTMIIALVMGSMLLLGIFYDYTSTNAAHDAAEKELARQKQIATQMDAINAEQAEIEKKTKDIQVRIDAIQKLRASQQGPGAVLQSIKERIDNVPGLYMESIENRGGELTIKGGSPNEVAVTRFGQSLEFSSGLFTNLNIETERKALDKVVASADPSEPKPEIVNFTVRCKYTPTGSSAPTPAAAQAPAKSAGAPSNQIAQK